MPIVAVRIPQIGEGLQEARLVAVLKNPGDKVKRDEPIYQMETDKAVMDVESPYEGTLTEWLAKVDTVLPIGGEVARMEVLDGVKEMEVHGGAAEAAPAKEAAQSQAESGGTRNANIPPRTRAYAKEKGISDADLAKIPAPNGKLMPADIDAYLSGGKVAASSTGIGGAYKEEPVNPKQRLLASRLVRGSQLVVPGTITVVTNWEPIERLRLQVKSKGGDFQPSAFTMFAFAVAQALIKFPHFRSTLKGEETLRTYDHASLGVAVALPGDELVLAVVENADALTWREFADSLRARIDEARGGKDQANEAVTISLTNMQAYGLRDAVPVVVPPSVGTIFLGETYNGLCAESAEPKIKRYVNLVLTFDHRIINGVGAANIMNAIKQNVETISSLITL
ncbi:MAG TPA: 2-oxo acid dehydrogenase subunit E2 [Fimbriimonadaceae bacterium]|jgi:pyruvate dehydrogenase E2 component (dihydrolipoamide acetyltransferase)